MAFPIHRHDGGCAKKAKRAGMPIADVELVMMASAAVLAAQHFPREVDDWEGLPAVDRTWRAWKVAFHLAHHKRQCQLQASGGGEPLGGAGLTPSYLPQPPPSTAWERLSTSSLSRRPTTPQSYSSSHRQTWRSLRPTTHCGQQEALGGFG
jgi:hypothetical protein